MNIKLTKDADKALCLIYKEYLIKCDTLSKSISKEFSNDDLDNLLCDFNSDDLDDILNELKSAKLIKIYITGDISLETNGIVYMENRFKNGLKEITDFISKFIP